MLFGRIVGFFVTCRALRVTGYVQERARASPPVATNLVRVARGRGVSGLTAGAGAASYTGADASKLAAPDAQNDFEHRPSPFVALLPATKARCVRAARGEAASKKNRVTLMSRGLSNEVRLLLFGYQCS
jgi:hypothetical protein